MKALLLRDLRLSIRAGGGFGLGLAFFLILILLVAFGLGPNPALLSQAAAGLLWLGALLACLLSLDRIFALDFEDGSLDLLATAPIPLEAVTAVKALAHWLTTGLPLLLAAPVLAVLLNLDVDGFGALILTMLLGTPVLSLIGAIGAALTVTVRRGGVLVSLLVLPLYVPVLIFGVSAIDAALHGLDSGAHILLLAALVFAALPTCPFAAAAAVKLALE